MKVYITFGQVHTHSVNGKTFDKDCIGVINCKDEEQGREIAMDVFGGVFHQCLTEANSEFMQYFPRGFIELN